MFCLTAINMSSMLILHDRFCQSAGAECRPTLGTTALRKIHVAPLYVVRALHFLSKGATSKKITALFLGGLGCWHIKSKFIDVICWQVSITIMNNFDYSPIKSCYSYSWFSQYSLCTGELCVPWFGVYHEVKPILRSDEEKKLVWRHREDQWKLLVKNISETFVKNAFYLLWIRVSW